jgi:hypothetical protein
VGSPGGNGSVKVGSTTANFQEWNGGVAVVIWTDIETGHTPGNASQGGLRATGSSGHISFSGQNSSADGRLVEWRGETSDGKTGVVTINETQYDLAEGSLFLVSTVGRKARVRQLKRDWLGLRQGGEGLKSLAKEDPEVKQFIADTSTQE